MANAAAAAATLLQGWLTRGATVERNKRNSAKKPGTAGGRVAPEDELTPGVGQAPRAALGDADGSSQRATCKAPVWPDEQGDR